MHVRLRNSFTRSGWSGTHPIVVAY